MTKKSFFISALTVFVQYYDYHLFAFLAAKIAKNFLPTTSSTMQLLNTYLIMCAAMVGKPVGAVIFGRIGDIYGRSNSFGISLIGTTIASLIISIAPNYYQVGLVSAFILLLARMITCALVSTGADGVRIYIYEHINKNSQCFAMGIITFFTYAGSLVASISAWFFTLDMIPDYGWRGAFLLGSILGVTVFTLKQKLNIQDKVNIRSCLDFEQFKNLSTFMVIKKNLKLFLLCTITAGSIGSTNQFFIIFFGTYNFALLRNINQSAMQFYTAIAICLYIIFSLVAGYIADRVGRYKVTNIAAIFILILSIGHIHTLSTNQVSIILFFLTAGLLPFLTIPATAILAEYIPTVLKHRMLSISHAIGSIIISAPTAAFSTFLYHRTKIAWLPIIYFIMTIVMISLSLKSIKVVNENKNSL